MKKNFRKRPHFLVFVKGQIQDPGKLDLIKKYGYAKGM